MAGLAESACVREVGKLDDELVRLLAKPELQDFEPELLCDALGEMDRMIDGETSGRKRRKMKKLRAAIEESDLYGLCKNKGHGAPSQEGENDDL